jgi:two-component system, NarL family, invasion response regulator UvrY
VENLGDTIKLALVDDHSLFREGVKLAITNMTNDISIVLEADSGKDLIEKLSKIENSQMPDIIILDIQMPLMDGIETATWLKREKPDIRTIMLTMHNDLKMVMQLLKIGVNGYLTKNTDSRELLNAIRMVMESGFYYSSFIAEKFIQSINNGKIDFKDQDLGTKMKGVIEALSEKESYFLKLACTNFSYSEIAKKMKISVRTVEVYRDRVFRKLGVNNRSSMVMTAMRNNLL